MEDKPVETLTGDIADPKATTFKYEKFTKLGTYKMGLTKIKDATKRAHPSNKNQSPTKGYRWVFRSYENPSIFVNAFTSKKLSTGKNGRESNLKVLCRNMSAGILSEADLEKPEMVFAFIQKCIGLWWDVAVKVEKDKKNPTELRNEIIDMGVVPNADTSSCFKHFGTTEGASEPLTNDINEEAQEQNLSGFEDDDLPESFKKTDSDDDGTPIPF